MQRFLLMTAVGAAVSLAACSGENASFSEDPTNTLLDSEHLNDDTSNGFLALGEKGVGVGAQERTYLVTVENLTPATGMGSSQPISPPVLATHNPAVHMFEVGSLASTELEGIAEDAINGPMIELLENSKQVHQVTAGSAPIPPGGSDSFEIATNAGRRNLSLVFMLVNTNDAFSGLDGVTLPEQGTVEYLVDAYDAGTEPNSELMSEIPGPCCSGPGMGGTESEPISMHPGITGDGDLDPAIYGWDDPVARITITRIAPTYEIELENMTPITGEGSSQVLSPPVIATHTNMFRMFQLGMVATDELAQIAEDAINGPMIAMLHGLESVHDVVQGGGPIPPGASGSYMITSKDERGFFSMATMLVNTNDGFTGVDRFPLPRGGRIVKYLRSYDAGSEPNTELIAHIPGPCCNSPEAGPESSDPITMHGGILGIGDLEVEIYDWDEPTARLTITRVK